MKKVNLMAVKRRRRCTYARSVFRGARRLALERWGRHAARDLTALAAGFARFFARPPVGNTLGVGRTSALRRYLAHELTGHRCEPAIFERHAHTIAGPAHAHNGTDVWSAGETCAGRQDERPSQLRAIA
jgi:hypothetical protein